MLSGRGRLASKDDLTVDTAVLLLTIVTLIIVVCPLIFVLSASVSEPLSVVRGEVKLLPVGFTLEGYGRILEYKPVWRGYANTIVYTVCGTIVSLVATIPGAYVLSRREIRGHGFFTTYFAITMFFNAGLVPTYLAVQSYGMLDTMWPLILDGAVSMSHLIVVRTYFNTSIPKDLSEAAFIDRCSDFRLFFEIMLPLAKPVIAVIALYAAVAQWNSYFKPLIYLSDPTKYAYFTQDTTEMEAKLAAESVGVVATSLTALVKNYRDYEAVPALTSPENDQPLWPMTSINYQRDVATMAITDKCSEKKAIALIKFANYLVTTEASLAARLGPSQQESEDGYGYTYERIENKHAYGATRTFPSEYSSYYSYRMSQTAMFLPAYINPLVDDVVVGSDDKNNWQTSLWTASGIYAHSRPVFDLQSTFTEEEQTDLAYYQELIDYATSSRAKFINGDVELNDETWQKYLDTLESYGMSDYIEMCQRAYDRYSALPETID